VNLKPRPLYPREGIPVPGWPHSRSGRFRRRKNLLPIPELDPQNIQPVESLKHIGHYLYEMDGVCSAYGGLERPIQGFGRET
jgi:hypothetical protein